MTDREVMQMALDAFEDLKKSVTRDGTVSENWDAYYEKEYYALEALRQALAQPEQTKCPRCGEVNPAEIHTCSPQVAQGEQEPVAYLCENAVGYKYFRWKKPTSHYKPIALYTAPPPKQWVGLTDEEIKGILDCGRGGLVDIKKAEQILKEKNNGST